VFWYSLESLFEISFIIRRTERDLIKMCIGLLVKHPYSFQIVMELEFSQQIFGKIFKYQITWKFGRWEPSWADGETWRS